MFQRYGEVPIPLPPIVLDENIRNTRQIAQVVGSLGAGQARYRGFGRPAGPAGSARPAWLRRRVMPRDSGAGSRAGSVYRSDGARADILAVA